MNWNLSDMGHSSAVKIPELILNMHASNKSYLMKGPEKE